MKHYQQRPVDVTYIFLELPNCGRALTEHATLLDNICYSLHNMQFLKERPAGLRQEIFDLLFQSVEIATFAPAEKTKYDYNMTTERDIRNQIRYAEKKGEAKHAIETAQKMKKDRVPDETIVKYTGLTEEQVRAL